MHILELIKTGKEKVSASWVIEAEITHIISNLYIFETFLLDKKQQEYIKGIRSDLVRIRHTIYDILKQDENTN